MTEFEKDKQEKIDEIKRLHSLMREIVTYNGIKESSYDEVIVELENKRVSYIETLLKHFSALHGTLYQEMLSVWTQPNMTSEMWHNYKLFSDKPLLAEQRQMYALRPRLKDRWKRLKSDLAPVRKDEPNGPTPVTEQETT